MSVDMFHDFSRNVPHLDKSALPPWIVKGVRFTGSRTSALKPRVGMFNQVSVWVNWWDKSTKG